MILKKDIVIYRDDLYKGFFEKALLYVEGESKKPYNKMTIRKDKKGCLAGYCAEYALLYYFKDLKQVIYANEIQYNLDYDLIINNRMIDVKTKIRSVPVDLHYNASVQSLHQVCNYYIFCNNYKNTLEIIGYISKQEFEKESFFAKKGDPDGGVFTFSTYCYNLPYQSLYPMKELYDHLKRLKLVKKP